MKLVKVLDQQIWGNDGTVALATLGTSGSLELPTPTEGASGVVHTSASVNADWTKLHLGGTVDRLRIVYRSRVMALGGLVNVTGGTATIVAVAQQEYFPPVATAAVFSAAGTGYAVADTITLAGGSYSQPVVLTVASISGGGGTGPVLTVTVTRPGLYTVRPPGPMSQLSTSGSGTDATFTVTWGSDSDMDVPAHALGTPDDVNQTSLLTQSGDTLACTVWENGSQMQVGAVSDVGVFSGGGLFQTASPVTVNSRLGWTAEIHPRINQYSAAFAFGVGERPKMSGIQDVWVAVMFYHATLTGTLATTKLKAAIRAFGYREVP